MQRGKHRHGIGLNSKMVSRPSLTRKGLSRIQCPRWTRQKSWRERRKKQKCAIATTGEKEATWIEPERGTVAIQHVSQTPALARFSTQGRGWSFRLRYIVSVTW